MQTLVFFVLLIWFPAGTRTSFRELLDREWQFELESNPEMATAIGDSRFNDRLSDYSPEGRAKLTTGLRKFLRQFEAVPEAELTSADKLNRQLMIRRLGMQIRADEGKSWEMPIDQMNGVQLSLAQLPANTTFRTAKDYGDYAVRLGKIPLALQEVKQTLRVGMRDRMMPPRFLLEQAEQETAAIASAPVDKSPFAEPLQHIPAEISQPERTVIQKRIQSAIERSVLPAYRDLDQFLRREYVPAGRKNPGIWSVPNGYAYYNEQIRMMTTTKITADEFHAIGLRQVGEIRREMEKLARQSGFSKIAEFDRSISANRDLRGQSGEQIRALYEKHAREMKSKMPVLFGRQPRAPLAVVAMDAFRAPNAVPADYSPGSADGSRPGRINVNEFNPTGRLLLNVEAIAYHEGIPGHHQQIALAQELEGLPAFRRHGDYNAYVEGWALYSERLAKEAGFYQDRYSEYGRLQNEMWRAIRLVVDTGVHRKHWTRQQMVDFFRQNTAMDEQNINTEVDRYIAWPAQALGYKAGQIEILELRARAQKKLGRGFDLGRFHDAVLGEGALPLDVLEERMNLWMAEEAGRKPGQSRN